MNQKNLKLAVKNFGPIREGEVEFKPLTVFIGPNNSGKSYMATLLYSLLRPLTDYAELPYMAGLPSAYFSDDDVDELHNWAAEILTDSFNSDESVYHRIHPILRSFFDAQRRGLETNVLESIREYFGCWDLSELVHNSLTDYCIDLFALDGITPLVSAQEEPSGSQSKIGIEQECLARGHVSFLRYFLGSSSRKDTIFYNLIFRQWRDKLSSNRIPLGNLCYLPAGRSGLLQGWQVTASAAVGMIGPRIGTQNFEIPSFPGIARDFTQELLRLMPPGRDNRDSNSMIHAIRLMEERVLGGTIHVLTNNNLPAIGYQSGDLEIPIQRSSSMISELAPIHLWMKHILKSGDVLIIDEPEAHLHPENQRLIARVLVRLMNAGVRVVCTTHSSLILHQLSNQILATSSGKLDEVGFTEHDRLSLDDIGVYLFELAEDGSRIKEVEIDSDFGISEDEFVRVAEQIGEETYQLVT